MIGFKIQHLFSFGVVVPQGNLLGGSRQDFIGFSQHVPAVRWNDLDAPSWPQVLVTANPPGS